MIGLIVDGQTGPVAMQVDLTNYWRVVYKFGRTKKGTIQIAEVILQPTRPNRAIPDEHGVTVQLWQQVKFRRVRRYLDSLRPRAARPVAAKRGSRGRPSKMTAADYRRLKREHDALILNDPHPSKTLAKRWGNMNQSTMRTWIAKARALSE